MTRKVADDRGLADRDRHLVDAIASEFAPEPRAPVQRRLFAEALDERIAGGRRGWLTGPVPVLAAAAALAVVMAIAGLPSSSPPNAAEESVAVDDTRGEVFVALALEDTADRIGDEFLPDEYAELADVLGL